MTMRGVGHRNFLTGANWLWLISLGCLSGRCLGQSWDGLGYSVSGTNITITGYTGPGGAVTIPSSIPWVDGTVTSIGQYAFEGCSAVTSVTIPSTVTTIGGWAFYGCSALTSITIPGGVTSIQTGAFEFCGLTNFNVPSNVTFIGDAAFAACSHLSAFTVEPQNPAYSSFGGVLFNKGQTVLFEYPGGRAGAYAIPSSVTAIEGEAFWECSGLASVTIPGTVTHIGSSAFWGCSGLASLTLPTSVTYIGQYAVAWCTGLTSFTLPGNLTSTGDETFCGCTGLTNVTIPKSITAIGLETFGLCSGLTSVTIPSSVTTVGDLAFEGCGALTNVYFQGSAPTSFGTQVFDRTAPSFSIYYPSAAPGWTTPIWNGYPAQPYGCLAIATEPLTQTAEPGTSAWFYVGVTNAAAESATGYQWYFGGTNALANATNFYLGLPAVQPAQAGAYTVVVFTSCGELTSDTALLSVIPPVTRRTVPAVGLTNGTGSLPALEYVDRLSSTPAPWSALTNEALNAAPPLCFDISQPLPAQRFYRARQTNGPPTVLAMSTATAIPLSGPIGSSVRVDYINQFGPTNAWVTLDKVVLTNTTQLFFDVSAFRQAPRLYRLISSP